MARCLPCLTCCLLLSIPVNSIKWVCKIALVYCLTFCLLLSTRANLIGQVLSMLLVICLPCSTFCLLFSTRANLIEHVLSMSFVCLVQHSVCCFQHGPTWLNMSYQCHLFALFNILSFVSYTSQYNQTGTKDGACLLSVTILPSTQANLSDRVQNQQLSFVCALYVPKYFRIFICLLLRALFWDPPMLSVLCISYSITV